MISKKILGVDNVEIYKVLLVDDEERIRKGFKKLLEEVIGGYQVIAEADNGQKAMECLLTCQVDLIFTDIRMPVMDGVEFIKKVRVKLPQIPIFVLSGYDEYEYMRHALKNNVIDYILKPIDRIELAQSLNRFKQMQGRDKDPESYELQKNGEEMDKRQIIRQIKEIIDQRLQQDISLMDIANEVKYSYTHLSTLFKKETGQAFSDYLIKARIEKAKQLLKETNFKIYEVGSLCGYPNSKYFMSVFKETVGMTPSEFRNSRVY